MLRCCRAPWSGRGVMPHRTRRSIAQASAVRKNAPVLYRLRTLSSTTIAGSRNGRGSTSYNSGMRTVLLIAAALFLTSCGRETATQTAEPDASQVAAESTRLTTYLDAEIEQELAMSPEQLQSLGRKEQYDKLDDYSDASADHRLEWRRKSVADMTSSFDYALLDADSKTSYDIWTQELDRAERRLKFRRHSYIFVRGGPHTAFPQFLINFHRVDDKRDAEAYIARLSAMKIALGQ